MRRKKYQNSNDEKVYIYSIYLYLINMKLNILSDRIAFYLDADGNNHWEYVGMIDDSDGTEFFENKPSDLNVEVGTCKVCGKTPIRYNFILRNTVPNPDEGWKYVSVGSECIQFLDRTDMLRIKRDQKALKAKQDKRNAIVFGSYIRDFLPEHPEVWKMEWEYFGHKKNLGGSLKFISEKCMAGEPMHEKSFGKELRKVLNQNGLELPDLREMKRIFNTPSYDDFKADVEAEKMAESAYEKFYESRSGVMNDPSLFLGASDLGSDDKESESEDEVKMVPDGYRLISYYGISPVTGQRDIMYETLKNLKTGEEEYPDVIPEWNPVIEVISAVDWDSNTETYQPIDVIYVHLQKFIARHRKEKDDVNRNDTDPVLKALQILAGNDPDFAGVRNNIGFNGRDTEFGHSLASQNHLSPKQKEYGKRLLRKYHRQIPKDLWDEIYGDEKNE